MYFFLLEKNCVLFFIRGGGGGGGGLGEGEGGGGGGGGGDLGEVHNFLNSFFFF